MAYAVTSVTFARPTDTSAYAAKDAVQAVDPAPITFAGLGLPNGGSGDIIKARLRTDQPGNVARYRLHLYNVKPPGSVDRTQFVTEWTQAAQKIGEIDFPAASTEGTGSTAAKTLAIGAASNLPLPFTLAAADTNFYGKLETLDAIAGPASGQQYFIELTVAPQR